MREIYNTAFPTIVNLNSLVIDKGKKSYISASTTAQ